jgi:hypothetical protein
MPRPNQNANDEECVMANADIPVQASSFKRRLPVPSAFERWATANQFDIAPAVLPAPDRVYADRNTQAVYEAWMAGGAHVVGMLMEATFETEAFREKMRELAMFI